MSVIEVDFRGSKTPADELFDKFSAIAQAADEEIASLRRQLVLAARRNTKLRRQLDAERRARFPFTDEAVLAALHRISAPVRAKAVAEALFPSDAPDHSVVVRVGLALGRLERGRMARRVARRGNTMWSHGALDDEMLR